MGLFGIGKKKEEKVASDIFSQTSLPSINDLHSNVPDDIPLQMPPMGFEGFKGYTPKSPYAGTGLPPFSGNEFSKQVPPFGPLNDVSTQMLSDPENPFERESRLEQVERLAYGQEAARQASSSPTSKGRMAELQNWTQDALPSYDAPLFINVLDFAQILEDSAQTKNHMVEMQTSISRVNGMQKDKDVQFASYSRTLELMQKKLIAVDKMLFEE